MSMHPQPIGLVPEDTARVARAAFPKGNLYMQMRDVLGTIYDDEDFSELFEVRGRPAITPWRLALVTLMQFSEGLSDRQAAEAVRARIDWKYALGLRLSDPGFDFSALSVGGTGSGELIMTLQRINQQYLPGSCWRLVPVAQSLAQLPCRPTGRQGFITDIGCLDCYISRPGASGRTPRGSWLVCQDVSRRGPSGSGRRRSRRRSLLDTPR
jgi:transposase